MSDVDVLVLDVGGTVVCSMSDSTATCSKNCMDCTCWINAMPGIDIVVICVGSILGDSMSLPVVFELSDLSIVVVLWSVGASV